MLFPNIQRNEIIGNWIFDIGSNLFRKIILCRVGTINSDLRGNYRSEINRKTNFRNADQFFSYTLWNGVWKSNYHDSRWLSVIKFDRYNTPYWCHLDIRIRYMYRVCPQRTATDFILQRLDVAAHSSRLA